MADTYPNQTAPAQFVSISSLIPAITAGTAIRIQNLYTADIRYSISASAPTDDTAINMLRPGCCMPQWIEIAAGESDVWVRSVGGTAVFNVQTA